MAIDHICVGYGRSQDGEMCLKLVDRDEISPGSRLFVITNPPKFDNELDLFVDAEIWGGATTVMVGNDQIATRDGYCGLTLNPDWRTIMGNYWRRKDVQS